MVSIEVTKSVFCQVAIITGNTVNKTIIKINSAAPFDITDRYDVIFTGDPS
jgi:hypothetical protein